MQRIGKYEILEQIGAGGFGIVYKGRDPLIERAVAVKTCNSDDEELRHRFVREARTAGRLQHRNITTVYDFGYHEGVPYLVQEYLTGEDLDRILKRGEKPPMVTRLRWLEQVARGLAYAHANGIVHRDVKPANVRILEDGAVKIMDFGIAKLLENDSGLTRAGATVGTAAYLAPEQLHGEPVDARTDLFAFGVLAYELLAGRRPFAGKQLSAVIYQILHHDPDPLDQLSPDCPAEVTALVARCLEKDRTKRPRSGDEVADELAASVTALIGDTTGVGGRLPVLRPPAATGAETQGTPSRPALPEHEPLDHVTTPLPTVFPPPQRSVETTSGIRELALDPDANNDNSSQSGTQAIRLRGVPWAPVAAVAGGLLVAVLGIAGVVQMVSRTGSTEATPTDLAEQSPELSEPSQSTEPNSGSQGSTSAPTEKSSTQGVASGSSSTGSGITPVAEVTPEPAEPAEPVPARLSIGASWSPTAVVEVAGRRLTLDRSHDLELAAGVYTLAFELTAPYQARRSIEVNLAPGDQRAVGPPFARAGVLTVQPQLGAPQGRIVVDGSASTTGVLRGLVLAPGRHQLRIEPLSAGSSNALFYEAEVPSGQELVVTFDLANGTVTQVVKPSVGG